MSNHSDGNEGDAAGVMTASCAPGRDVTNTIRQRGDTLFIKFPYSEDNSLDNQLEITLYTTDGLYNRTLVVAEQQRQGCHAILRFHNCPREGRYGASIAWVDRETNEKIDAYTMFDDVPWEELHPQEEESE